MASPGLCGWGGGAGNGGQKFVDYGENKTGGSGGRTPDAGEVLKFNTKFSSKNLIF